MIGMLIWVWGSLSMSLSFLNVLVLVILEYDPWDVKIGKESGCLDLDKLAGLKATLVQNYDPVTDGCEV